jgi:hypothetical protein
MDLLDNNRAMQIEDLTLKDAVQTTIVQELPTNYDALETAYCESMRDKGEGIDKMIEAAI